MLLLRYSLISGLFLGLCCFDAEPSVAAGFGPFPNAVAQSGKGKKGDPPRPRPKPGPRDGDGDD